MHYLQSALNQLRNFVRRGARLLARLLQKVSGGHIKPDYITYTSLGGHFIVAGLLITMHPKWAALCLVIFGLMDTLDGELARLQGSDNPAGMLLDAATDRIKESLVYAAAGVFFVKLGHPGYAIWAIMATAGALVVSYVKAKGETAVLTLGTSRGNINRLFQDGLMRYEVRMFVVVVGLISGWLGPAIVLLALLSWITAIGRLHRITKYLHQHAQN